VRVASIVSALLAAAEAGGAGIGSGAAATQGAFAEALRAAAQAAEQPTKTQRGAQSERVAVGINSGWRRGQKAPRGKARSWSVAQDRRMAKKARNVRRAKARAR